MIWPFEEAEEIISELGGQLVGRLDAHWKWGMPHTRWLVVPKNLNYDIKDVRVLEGTIYELIIYTLDGKIAYSGTLTFGHHLSAHHPTSYPHEISPVDWLDMCTRHFPVRIIKCL